MGVLSKWKWGILVEKEPLWKKIIEAKYVDCKDIMLSSKCCNVKVPSSTWWKDVTKVRALSTNLGFHFVGFVFYKIGDGSLTRFRTNKMVW